MIKRGYGMNELPAPGELVAFGVQHMLMKRRRRPLSLRL